MHVSYGRAGEGEGGLQCLFKRPDKACQWHMSLNLTPPPSLQYPGTRSGPDTALHTVSMND